MRLFLATDSGLVVGEHQGSTCSMLGRSLTSRQITSVVSREGAILAGSTDGVYASTDGGLSWSKSSEGLTIPHVRWLAYHPDRSDLEFAGIEPAGLFVSEDGGNSWRSCHEVMELRDEHRWWLPYSSEAGCVRGFAFHGKRAYAAVEVGAALRSDDTGQSWRLAGGSDGRPEFGAPLPGRVHPDVHSIEVHADSPDLVRAPTGGGFYASDDGGDSWRPLYEGCYVRAVWLNPADNMHMVLGPSDGPSGKNGRIEETFDGGATWLASGMRWNRNMVERFYQAGSGLYAVMANGQLYFRSKNSEDWAALFTDVPGIRDVSTMA